MSLKTQAVIANSRRSTTLSERLCAGVGTVAWPGERHLTRRKAGVTGALHVALERAVVTVRDRAKGTRFRPLQMDEFPKIFPVSKSYSTGIPGDS